MDQAARVQRIRVPGHTGSPDRVKQQVTRWLEAQTPARLGLPADAIVVLRSVRAPWSALQPDSPADVLGQRLRHAVRPAMGSPMGAACDAVWFADEAELLACLARDSLQGQLGQRWWWQTWLGHRPSHEEALQAWLNAARCVPAAMSRLNAMGQGLAWARDMGSAGRLALLQAMQRHHPINQAATDWLLRSLLDAPLASDRENRQTDASSVITDDRRDAEAIGHSGVRHHVNALPLPDQAGNDGASVLLALCTLLHEAPHLALDERKLADRLQPAVGVSKARPLLAAATDASPRRDVPTPGQPSRSDATDSSPRHRHRSATGAPVSLPSHQAPNPRLDLNDARGHADDGHAPKPIAPPSALKDAAPTAREDHASPIDSTRASPVQRPDATVPLASKQVTQSAHGGVFFLLNVALAWELYGDFTRPRHTVLSVSPWQFLHAAAIALLGRPFAADPLAGWLRAQAIFSRPRPASALGGSPLSLLPKAEASRLRATAAPRATRPDDELRTWWPLLRQRLSLALNLPEHEAVTTCLNLPARIERRGERVDVCFSLHHLPLSIRLAGLDRDPGWLPASGCDIRFHFEA